ncbi:hypothetical protein [Actinophytocola sp.]|uniref:hypothetical protein n=1 Tax=Actinophytocola sp. TaxID=1872138 RepID=UPI002D7F65C0|nr:hypothetical protein [Actinophytocola sp.]HET9138759.1 hypothetical protein [Actinophytocola sp.]
MFADAATRQRGSQWADQPHTSATPDTPRAVQAGAPPDLQPVAQDDVDEKAAVLTALDEALDAFAALPGPVDTDDLEDFERGIRQLRRIVLSRAASTPDPAP